MGIARRILADQVPKQFVCRGLSGTRQPGRRSLECGIGCWILGNAEHWTASGNGTRKH